MRKASEMQIPQQFRPELESLKQILLVVSREQSLEAALALMTDRLAQTRPRIGRAAIWLTGAVEQALAVPPRTVADPESSLYLVASACKGERCPMEELPHSAGDFRHVPFSEPLIGRVAADASMILSLSVEGWAEYASWAVAEGISGYVAGPLLYGENVLGVLAIFADEIVSREPKMAQEAREWMQLFCDHAAAAVANALAFAEIERLRRRLQVENDYLREEVSEIHSGGHIVGRSPGLAKVLEQVTLVAPTNAVTLIQGESGTGKELVARAIHEKSERKERPLIKVNCSSVPRDLFESEFFGHVKGAFTGAVKDRVGRFELADGGTLFLDEIGEIPPELQSKLLRVLQEGEFNRVGDETTRTVDARVLAATNRDLWSEVEAGRFRQDLYYRLAVFPIDVPPLRDRGDDVAMLGEHFITQSCRRLGMAPIRLQRRHIAELKRYHWPGNIRELQNVIERAVILSRRGRFSLELPRTSGTGNSGTPPDLESVDFLPEGERPVRTYEQLREDERRNVEAALKATGWKVSGPGGAAEMLGVRPTTLISRMKAMGIERPR